LQNRMDGHRRACIIGAGLSGLVAAKVFLSRGYEVVVVEKGPEIGGVWAPSKSYPGVCTQTPRDLYCFSDFPMPRSYPEWPGDVARLDDDGYLFIVDRMKDMIITGGENVYSKEIEDVLSGHPAVSEVAVYGIPHGEWGETVVAAIVPKIRHVLNADDVREYLVGRLAKFKIPRQIHFLERLPRTPIGKVQKYLLRQSRVGGDTIPPNGA
jgi:acyl-CoA synthetase (AMP-forming)/AMP-acid ligase II